MTAQNKLLAVALVAATCVVVPGYSAAGPVTIPNWDFSDGSSGFSSDYVNPALSRMRSTLSSNGLLWPEDTYAVGTDPSLYHCLWPSLGDHTTGDGSMLIVNGSLYAGAIVWSATVDVLQYTRYDFSAWVTSVYADNPARVVFYINDLPLGAPYDLSATTGLWQQFNAGWDSGAETTAVMSLVDLNTEAHGNDFGVDDIELRTVPDGGTTLFLLGGALAGFATLRRKLGT